MTAAVLVGVKGQIHGSRTVAELAELACIQVGAQRAGDVMKSGLPHRGIVEQTLDENHGLGLGGLKPSPLGDGFSTRAAG